MTRIAGLALSDDDRRIWRLAWPTLGALTAEPLYVLADTAVVGHLGTAQLGGLALASSILLLVHATFIFLAYGTTAAVARLLGAGQRRRAAHQAVQSVWLAAAAGAALAVAGFALAPELTGTLGGADAAVRHNAVVYLRISLIGLPAMLVTLAGVGYLRGLQDARRPFAVALASAAGNLVLEAVLIFGFGLGIGASALSTVIAQTLAALVYAAWIRSAAARFGVGMRPDPAAIAGLAAAGADLLVRTLALRGGLVVTVAVAARIGTDDLAAHQIALEVWTALALALDAVAIAGQALIGQALGASDAPRARQLGRRMIGWGLTADGDRRGAAGGGDGAAACVHARPGGGGAGRFSSAAHGAVAARQRRGVRARRRAHRRRRLALPRRGDARVMRGARRRRGAGADHRRGHRLAVGRSPRLDGLPPHQPAVAFRRNRLAGDRRPPLEAPGPLAQQAQPLLQLLKHPRPARAASADTAAAAAAAR